MGRESLRRALVTAALTATLVGCSTTPRLGVRALAPASLAQSGGDGERKVGHRLRVRVWADDGYRREHVRWTADVERLIGSTNELLHARFGVELEVVEAKAWEQYSRDDALDARLKQLERHDEGKDVDLVVGFVSALPVFERSVHALGMARYLGRHFVLRGMHDIQEREVVERWRNRDFFGGDSDEDVERVYLQRVRHREIVVLVHELGHALGMMHVADPKDLMNPYCDATQSRIAAENARIFELSLVQLVRARAKQTPDFTELMAYVRQTQTTLWGQRDREELLATLQGAQPRAPRPGPTARETSTATVAPRVAGEEERALCVERLESDDLTADLRGPCTRVMELRPDDASAALNLANVEARLKDDPRLGAALAEGKARLERNGTPELWLYYARLCSASLRVSEAEDAAAKAGEGGAEVLRWAESERKQMNLPRDEVRSGVSRAMEPDYLRRMRELGPMLGRDPRAAGAALAGLLAKYPRAAMVWVAECGRRLGQGEPSRAQAACRRALELDPTLWRAHLTAGLVAAARGRTDEAIRHAERASSLEPDARSPWAALAGWYRRAGRTRQLERLARDYAARFHEELPGAR